MRHNPAIMVFILATVVVSRDARASRSAQSSQATDPVVVHIQGSVILESQVKELSALQVLTQGVPDSRDRLVQELIEQWIVTADAMESGFPSPSSQLVDIEEARLAGQFPNSEAYASKLREVGLSTEGLRQLLSRQILVERYLDHKFRPTIQINESDIETYYQKEWLPALARENESAVPLSEAQDRIREVLTQQEIRSRSAKWISETESHLQIEPARSAGVAQ